MVIVEKDCLRGIITLELLNNIENILKGKYLDNGENLLKNKIKLIPFSSLGNENGLLIGFKPDYIRIFGEIEFIQKNVIIRYLQWKII